MKKLIPVIFVIVAAGLAFFFVGKNLFIKDNSYSRAKIIKPVVEIEKSEEENLENEYEDYEQTSFIELANDETLLNVVTMDIDDDGYDDQINIVKTSRSPFLALIVGLYNPSTSSYVRAAWIATTVSQIRTFACTALDVIGNHKNSLVYQGITDEGHSVLCIFNGSRTKKGDFVLTKIGDFESDGTVFIQQTERNEAYELSQTKADSFPVWVYASDSAEDSARLDQIQTMYDWNEKEGEYTQVKQVRVTGNRIAAKELARIQDGTVATFSKFLEGLWYKTENSGGNVRYIFFDPQTHEIIFHYQDSEEVYSWLNAKLRRNGMYYKKVSTKLNQKTVAGESEKALKRLVEGPAWTASDGKYFVFANDVYIVESEKFTDKGRFVLNSISDTKLMQFRSDTDIKFFNGYYSASFGKIKKTERNKRGKTTEFVVDDNDTVILQSVDITPNGFFQNEVLPLTLKKTELKKTEE